MGEPKVEVYKDFGGEYRWRFKTRNGRIMADSAESYTRKSDAMRAGKKFLTLAAEAEIVQEADA